MKRKIIVSIPFFMFFIGSSFYTFGQKTGIWSEKKDVSTLYILAKNKIKYQYRIDNWEYNYVYSSFKIINERKEDISFNISFKYEKKGSSYQYKIDDVQGHLSINGNSSYIIKVAIPSKLARKASTVYPYIDDFKLHDNKPNYTKNQSNNDFVVAAGTFIAGALILATILSDDDDNSTSNSSSSSNYSNSSSSSSSSYSSGNSSSNNDNYSWKYESTSSNNQFYIIILRNGRETSNAGSVRWEYENSWNRYSILVEGIKVNGRNSGTLSYYYSPQDNEIKLNRYAARNRGWTEYKGYASNLDGAVEKAVNNTFNELKK